MESIVVRIKFIFVLECALNILSQLHSHWLSLSLSLCLSRTSIYPGGDSHFGVGRTWCSHRCRRPRVGQCCCPLTAAAASAAASGCGEQRMCVFSAARHHRAWGLSNFCQLSDTSMALKQWCQQLVQHVSSGTTSLHPCFTGCWHALLAADMLIYVDYSSKRHRHKQSKNDDVFKKVSQALLDQVNQQNSEH